MAHGMPVCFCMIVPSSEKAEEHYLSGFLIFMQAK